MSWFSPQRFWSGIRRPSVLECTDVVRNAPGLARGSVCNPKQTTGAWRFHTLDMRIDQTKATLASVWIALMAVIGYLVTPQTMSGWTILTAVALTPPIVMMCFWGAPTRSMSETIQKELR